MGQLGEGYARSLVAIFLVSLILFLHEKFKKSLSVVFDLRSIGVAKSKLRFPEFPCLYSSELRGSQGYFTVYRMSLKADLQQCWEVPGTCSSHLVAYGLVHLVGAGQWPLLQLLPDSASASLAPQPGRASQGGTVKNLEAAHFVFHIG